MQTIAGRPHQNLRGTIPQYSARPWEEVVDEESSGTFIVNGHLRFTGPRPAGEGQLEHI
jgi:hypothetical protein